jgi:hypothetical protein
MRQKIGSVKSPILTENLMTAGLRLSLAAAAIMAGLVTTACGTGSQSTPNPTDSSAKAISGKSSGLGWAIEESFYALDMGGGFICGYSKGKDLYAKDNSSKQNLVTKNGPIRQSDLLENIDEFILEQINSEQNEQGRPLDPTDLREIRNVVRAIQLVGVTTTVPFSLVGGILSLPVGVVLEIRNLFKKENIDYPFTNIAGTLVWGTIPTWFVLAKTDEKLDRVNTSLEGYQNKAQFNPKSLSDEDTVNEVSGAMVGNVIRIAEGLSKKSTNQMGCPEPKT